MAQPCLTNWTVSASTPPVNGTYACGETVTFCITVTGWNQSNANWFHGVEAIFGPGWNLSTVVPGPPPPSCSGFGTWGYYNSVQGTSFFTNIGPQGPGFFFDLNNDGNAGNNFGDNCTGSGNWQFCWTVTVLDGPACVNGTGLSVSFDTFSDSQTGSWSGAGCNNDPIVPLPPAVIGGTCTIDAGSDGNITLCSTSATIDLLTVLGGTPDTGGTWSVPGGGAFSGTFIPGVSASGAYQYTVTSVSPPCSETASVSVTVVEQTSAGSDGAITACASDPAFPLFDLLGNSPDLGGTWSSPSGTAFSGNFDPAVDAPGAYTYSIPATLTCNATSAVVEVSITPTPNAGANSSLTVCSTGDAVSLFDELGGSQASGGAWISPDGSPSNGIHQPGIDPQGAYVYTVAGTAPCPGSSATVSITENVQPTAGNDGATTLCQSDEAVDLFDLLEGSPDANGTWSNASGAAVPAVLDPQTAQSGTYTYTVSALAPCVDVSSVVDVTIVPGVAAGTDGSIALCSTDAPATLFDELGGIADAGGTWTAPNGQVSSGIYQPGIDLPGDYVYVVSGTAPCPNSSAEVSVSETEQPSAGTDGVAILCETSGPTALLTFLGGIPQAGGSWTAPDGSTSSGVIDTQVASSGGYIYTVDAPAPCSSAQSVVDVTINLQSDAGTDGGLTLCTGGDAVLLSTLLGGSPDSGGTWTGNSGPVGPVFTPGVDPPGVFTYTIPSAAPCTTSTAVVTVSVTDQSDAGEDGEVTLCSAPQQGFTLFGALEGTPDPGGVWSAPNGLPHGPEFTPGTDEPGTYTYTIAAVAPCVTVSSVVEVLVVDAAQAGTGGNVVLCEDEGVVDPFTWLTGAPEPNGVWTAPDGTIVSTVDLASAAAGTYLYTVQGESPCPADQATVALSIDPLPIAGEDALLSVCSDAPASDLFDLLGPDAAPSGTWSGPDGASNGNFIPGTSAAGGYTYTVQGTGGCAGRISIATIEVTVLLLPEPEFLVEPASGCMPLVVSFTNTTLGDTQSATWDFGDGGSSSSPTTVGHTYFTSGNFTVSLTVTDANGCSATATTAGAVLVSDGPPAFFTPTPLRVNQQSPVFDVTHSAQTDVEYIWSFGGEVIDGGTSFSYTIDPPEVGAYPICLVATDTLGCSNELCIDILIVDDITINVPNAFTPDGDGINDVFAPVLISVDPDEYLFMVFDRWGAEVFASTDVGSAWNGGFRNQGEALPTGVYVWRLTARDPFSADRRELLGSVTLIK
ncbi:MAG: PKD domain-containing protein [Flavobacteriales bacterium]